MAGVGNPSVWGVFNTELAFGVFQQQHCLTLGSASLWHALFTQPPAPKPPSPAHPKDFLIFYLEITLHVIYVRLKDFSGVGDQSSCKLIASIGMYNTVVSALWEKDKWPALIYSVAVLSLIVLHPMQRKAFTLHSLLLSTQNTWAIAQVTPLRQLLPKNNSLCIPHDCHLLQNHFHYDMCRVTNAFCD